jgi:acetoin utilization protein AcuB
MLVKDRMSHPVITVQPDTPLADAYNLMRKESVRRFPVVDSRGHLLGIVTEKDLLHASPSDATSLSIWEVNYLLSKITVGSVMAENVITVSENIPLEEAARIMTDNNIGGLPVLREGEIVGMITETDLIKIFLELLGARDPGVRITALVPNIPGQLAKFTKAIFDVGGNILSLGTFLGESSENREFTLKVEGADLKVLAEAIEPYTVRITEIRDSSMV